jgi:putative membrane protein
MKYCIRFAFVVLSGVVTAAAHAQGYPDHPHMWGNWGWGGMMLGPLTMLIFVAAIVVVVILLVRWLGGGSAMTPPAPTGKTAIDILKERFARGEIDKEEFEERRRLLSD